MEKRCSNSAHSLHPRPTPCSTLAHPAHSCSSRPPDPAPVHFVQVCLMGLQSRYVVSTSDDGHIFIWDMLNGSLVNMLAGAQGSHCVQVRRRVLGGEINLKTKKRMAERGGVWCAARWL